MFMVGQQPYPGDGATRADLLALANEYRLSAEVLLASVRSGRPLSSAPYRLVAIHAIELYLNAYLVSMGYTPSSVRGLQHDMAARAQLAVAAKLDLRKRTASHLATLSRAREYLIVRYDPTPTWASQLNRLQATLTEVAHKVLSSSSKPSSNAGCCSGSDQGHLSPD